MDRMREKLRAFAAKHVPSSPPMKTMINPQAAALTFDKHCPLTIALKAIDTNVQLGRDLKIARKRLLDSQKKVAKIRKSCYEKLKDENALDLIQIRQRQAGDQAILESNKHELHEIVKIANATLSSGEILNHRELTWIHDFMYKMGMIDDALTKKLHKLCFNSDHEKQSGPLAEWMLKASACLFYFICRPKDNPYLRAGEIVQKEMTTYHSAAKLTWYPQADIQVNME